MAQNIINTGASANDGQGDPLRTAFIKTDENFDQIWNAGPVGSNITILNNVIASTNTNGNIVIRPNGVGVIQANAAIVPNATNTRDLGSANLTWRRAYIDSLTIANIDVSNDLTVSGNLTVIGNTIQLGNVTTDSKTIQLANTATNIAQANGSGVTVGAADNIATLLYNSNTNVWTTNIGLTVSGAISGVSLAVSDAIVYGNVDAVGGNFTANVTANYFIGDGSQLTGLPAGYANANAASYGETGWAGNIIPATSNTYSLGNATNQWSDLYVSNATIYMNNVPIGLTAGNVLTVNGADVVTTSNDEANIANLTVYSATISVKPGAPDTDVYISPSGESFAFLQVPTNDTANVTNTRLHNDAGNVEIGAGDSTTSGPTYEWEFTNSGTLTFPDSQTSVFAGLDNDFTIDTANTGNATYTFTFGQFGDLSVPVNLNVSGNVYTNDIVGTGEGNITVTANTESWLFETDGRLFLPNSGVINASGPSVDIGSEDAISLEANTVVNIYTDTNGAGHQWQFGDAGELTLPASSEIKEVANPGGFPGYALALVPDPDNAIDADQKLLVYPTGGVDANHLHITSGNLYNTELFLGNDTLYVKLANTGNIVLNANDNTGNTGQWTFDTTGNLTIPGTMIVTTGITGSGASPAPSLSGFSSLSAADISVTGNITAGNINTEGIVTADGVVIDTVAGISVQFGDVDILGTTGLGGNINAVGANISGNVSASYFIGDGSQLTGLPASYGDANVVSLLSAFGSNTISTTGNITAGNFVGTGSNVEIVAGSYDWTFDNTGNLTLPGNTFAVNYANGTAVSLGGAGTYGDSNVVTLLGAFGSNSISTTGNVSSDNLVATGNGNVLTLTTRNGDSNNSNASPQIIMGYAGTGDYPSFIHTTHNAGTPVDNTIEFWTSDGTQAGTFPANAVLGLTVTNGNIEGNVSGYAIGYRDIPQVTFSANATAALTDAGKHYYSTTAGNLALTLPDNSNVAFATGTALTIVVNAAGNVLVNQGTGVTLYQAGSATTGNRVVGAYGMATVMKVAANTWVINGTGVY